MFIIKTFEIREYLFFDVKLIFHMTFLWLFLSLFDAFFIRLVGDKMFEQSKEVEVSIKFVIFC
jgi:hypothetical protein